MKRYDRLMAIRRHPEFIKDYKRFIRYKRPYWKLQKQIELEKKWNVELWAVKNAKQLKDTANPVKVAHRINHSRRAHLSYADDTHRPIPGNPRTRENSLLYLEIDLNDSTEAIIEGIKRRVKHYKLSFPTNLSKRNREATVDIWNIHDRHKQGASPLHIAKQLSGETGSLLQNPTLQTKYDTVKRAIKKADGLIKAVTPKKST